MFYSPVYDMPVGPFIAMFFALGIVALTIIAFLEASVLTRLKWKRFWPSVLASCIANIASALAGFLLIDVSGRVDSPIILFFIYYVGSTIIEGIVLYAFKPGSLRGTAIASIAMNTASYTMIGIFWLIGSAPIIFSTIL